jgi:hypothetical protein
MSDQHDRRQRRDRGGRDSTSMVWLFGWMMRLPLATFVYSLEMLVRTMQGIQRSFDQSVGAVSDGLAGTLDSAARGGGGGANAASMNTGGDVSTSSAGTTRQTMNEEDNDVGDQDLGGDDLKIVRYRIIFTKRDFEATLEKGEEEVVDYPTNGASFGGLKVAHFLAKLARGKVPLPREWKGKSYPRKNAPETGWRIPPKDERYIMFLYEVVRRVEREEAEYAKDKVQVLREIRDIIDERGVRVRSGGS